MLGEEVHLVNDVVLNVRSADQVLRELHTVDDERALYRVVDTNEILPIDFSRKLAVQTPFFLYQV